MKLARSPHVPLLLMGFGLLLLLNPLYAFSEGMAPTNQYSVEEIGEDEDDIKLALQQAHNVHFCPGVRTCLGEERIAEEDSIIVETAIFEYQREYDVIWINGQYYRPTIERTDDGDHRLSHEELTLEEALSAASLSSDDAGSKARSAIRWGVVGSDHPVPALEKQLILEHDGTYYQPTIRARSSTGVLTYRVVAVRLVSFALGILLILAGYRRYQRLLRGESETGSSRS